MASFISTVFINRVFRRRFGRRSLCRHLIVYERLVRQLLVYRINHDVFDLVRTRLVLNDSQSEGRSFKAPAAWEASAGRGPAPQMAD